MKSFTSIAIGSLCVFALLATAPGCKKKFEIQDVDPGKAGVVRSLGPESQDVMAFSDQMARSLLASDAIKSIEAVPSIAMLPLENNTRYPFNTEIFTSLLKAELNKGSEGRFRFVARDVNADIVKEREMKREGQVDYDPALRSQTRMGADYFLKGYANGLSTASTKGQSDTIIYTFKLVDAETGSELWEDVFMTKKEGKDDVIYR